MSETGLYPGAEKGKDLLHHDQSRAIQDEPRVSQGELRKAFQNIP